MATSTQSGLPAGVLQKMVQIPSDNSPNFTQNDATYVEKWKGPYNVLKDYPATRFIVGRLRSQCIPSDAVSLFDPPAPVNGRAWYVTGCKVEEIEAGDHAIMTVTYSSSSQGGGGGSGTWEDDPVDDVWLLNWQSYSVSPYAFCANNPALGPYELSDYEVDYDDTASRGRIEDFIHYRCENTGLSTENDSWCYKLPSADKKKASTLYTLNGADRLIYGKMLDATNAIYHYPVLTHQTSKSFSGALSSMSSYPVSIGNSIDYKSSLPSGCPYQFPSSGDDAWEWLKIADDMTEVKNSSLSKAKFVRREVWQGARKWDDNYYGTTPFSHSSSLSSCRWKIGAV